MRLFWSNLVSVFGDKPSSADAALIPSGESTEASPLDAQELEARVLYSASPIEFDLPTESLETPIEFFDSPLETPEFFQPSSVMEWGDDSIDNLFVMEQPLEQFEFSSSNTDSNEIVFVDSNVADWQQLLADLDGRNLTVVMLEANLDGIQQISAALANQAGLTAIHLISHGNDNTLNLGSTALTSQNISAYAGEIAGWNDALVDGADMLIYGCNLAASESGRDLIDGLGALSGSDVAASNDATGHASLGGDWDLEYVYGDLTTSIIVSSQLQSEWEIILASPVAVGDSYSVNKDGSLVVDPGGVLANDTDADLDSLTSTLNGDVSNGILALSSDGSFTYTPNAGFVGTDSFSYVANDGSTNSNIANVTIEVGVDVTGGDPSIWFSTLGSADTANGVNWDETDIMQVSDPNFNLEPGTTSGTVGPTGFSAPVNVRGFHLVHSTSVMVGDTQVLQGDILFAVDVAHNFGTFNADRHDIVHFRPDSLDDYSSGTYSMFLDEGIHLGATAYNVHGISLIERDVTVGGQLLSQGTLVVAHSTGDLDDNLYTVDVTSTEMSAVVTAPGTITADRQEFLRGSDFGSNLGFADEQIQGIEVLEESITMGGTFIAQGSILLTLNIPDAGTLNVGGNGLTVSGEDIFFLTVANTHNTGGTNATATLLFEGNDLGLNSGAVTGAKDENINGLSLINSLDVNSAPVLGANQLTISEGGSVTLNSSDLAATDVDDLDSGLTFTVTGISGGQFESITAVGVEITSFTQQEITDSEIIFVHDGGEAAPVYSITVDDGSKSDGPVAATIGFTNVNDAPVLDNSGNLILSPLIKDDFTNSGNTVAEIIASNFGNRITDADGDPEGIAITGFDNSNGGWEYSIDGGSNWLALAVVAPSINPTNAIVLDSSARVRFVPNASFVGTSGTISFKAWDGTDGSANGASGIDASVDGGINAFSTASETATVDVVESLIANNDSYSINENQTLTVGGIGVLENDDVHVPDITSGALLNYQADFSGSTPGFWEDTTNVPLFDIDTTGTTYDPSPVDSSPGVVSSYVFSGTGIGSTEGLELAPGDPTDGNATLEVWFRPTDLTGKEVIFETGGSDLNESGFALRTWGSSLELTVYNNDGTQDVEYLFGSLSSAFSVGPGEETPFAQITIGIEYVDADADTLIDDITFRLSVNGVLQDIDTLFDVPSFGWSQGENFNLGNYSGSAEFWSGGTSALDGEIGIFRVYDSLLTGAEIQQNYDAVATLTVVPPTDSVTANGVAITVNSDGSFVYNPGTLYNGLAVGESASDSFTYTAQDGFGNTNSATVNININGVDDAPTVISGIADDSTNEDELFTLDISGNFADVDTNDVLTYSAQLSGALPLPTWLLFNTTTGEFSGTPTNSDVGTYTIEVTADDGNGGADAEDTFVLTVVNVNDAPTITSDGGGSLALKNTEENTLFVTKVIASDADPTTDTITYSIIGGPDQLLFEIDPGNGDLTFKVAPDFEFKGDADTDGVYEVQVQAHDGNLSNNIDTQTILVTVTDVNENPVVADQPFSVDENAGNGTSVGAIAWNDVDAGVNGNVTFTVTGGTGATAFNVDSAGNITVADSSQLDFETTTSFTIDVLATDGGTPGLTDVATITISLNDLNEAPVVADQPFGVDENAGNGTSVGSIAWNDVDAGVNGNVTFTVTGGTGATAFNVDSAGNITVADSSLLDFETTTSFTIDVLATDGGTPGLTDTATITISLNDLNEDPVVADQPFSVDEDASNGTSVGSIIWNDPDLGVNGDVTFTVTGGTGVTAFSVDSAGNITVADNSLFDFELTPSYTIDVLAVDGGTPGLSDTATITISLNDLNEAPIVADQPFGIDENTSNGVPVGTIVWNDDDAGVNGDVTFTVTGGTGTTAFNVDSAGNITVADSSLLDFETTTSFTIDVLATDGGTPGLTDTATITISLNDLNEVPVVADQPFGIDENTSNGTSVGAIAWNDDDAGVNGNVTFTVTGGTGTTAFNVDSAGNITVADSSLLDFETTTSFTIDVLATDGGTPGMTDTATITIGLNDLNEAPVLGANQLTLTNGTTVTLTGLNLSASDVDAGASLAFTVSTVMGGQFEHVSLLGTPIFAFTQAQLDAGEIVFVDNGDGSAPSYDVTVDDGSLSDGPNAANITFVIANLPPSMVTNQLTLSEGQTVVMTSSELSATDLDSSDPALVFSVSGLSGGRFALLSSPNVAITSFSQGQVLAGDIVFVDDGDEFAPSYNITVSDGAATVGPLPSAITFTNVNDAPNAVDDNYTAASNTTFLGSGLLSNDTDPDDSVLNALLNTNPANGTVTVNADGSFIYIPNSGFSGTDSFTYLVNDGDVNSAPATVFVNVIGPAIITPPVDESDPKAEEDDDAPVEVTLPIDLVEPSEDIASLDRPAKPIPIVVIRVDDAGDTQTKQVSFELKLEPQQATWTLLDRDRRSLDSSWSASRSAFDSDLRMLERSGWFWQQLDRNSEHMESQAKIPQLLLQATAALTSGMTVGYLVWVVKGGQIAAAVIANLPAWRFIDPMPILSTLMDDDDDDESLQTIIEDGEADLMEKPAADV